MKFGIALHKPGTCLRISGDDAFPFLQGQFTQDLRPCTNGRVAYGLWLDQKGKVIGDSYVFRGLDGAWIVESHDSAAATLRERLEAYIIADDVAIGDLSATWAGLTGFGPHAVAWLASKGASVAADNLATLENGYIFHGRRGVVDSWEWIGPATQRDTLLSAARADGAVDADPFWLEYQRILAGVPRVPTDLGPKDLPGEGGLEESAISYTKGCYLGQEVMARLKSMGKVRRKLIRVRGEGSVPAPLPAELSVAGKRTGELRSAVREVGGEGFVGLAMITLLGFDLRTPLSITGTGAAVRALEDDPGR